MNPHILSTLERTRILTFIDDEQETPAIRNIRSRSRKNLPQLREDMALIAAFLDKKGSQVKWEN